MSLPEEKKIAFLLGLVQKTEESSVTRAFSSVLAERFVTLHIFEFAAPPVKPKNLWLSYCKEVGETEELIAMSTDATMRKLHSLKFYLYKKQFE